MSIIGYVIVDRETHAIDWDGDLHATRESAIQSMTGPHHGFVRTADEEDEDHQVWWNAYWILPVMAEDSEDGAR
jgi:hypothetical protein